MNITTGVKNLIIANAIAFLLCLLPFNLSGYFAAWPFDSELFNPLQLLTYQFVHGGFMHLLMNMLGLFFLGPQVEEFLGTKKFYIYYLLCGVMAALLQLTFIGGPLVGASGAVFGILALFGCIYPNRDLYFMFIPIAIKAKYLIGFAVGCEVLQSLTSHDNVGHLAHVGGAITGFILYQFSRNRFRYFTRR
jgi:membrane associated rhomboid family serine protease